MADSANLTLWRSVEKTPTEQTKKITGKSYQGNSPKPHWIVMRATETFGPCGIGWGFTVEERVEDGAMIEPGFFEKMHVAKVRVWFKWNGERGEVEHVGGTMFSGRYASGKLFTDEDAPKKSVTDALIKALSMIGFAGDIFLGRYDDSKYLAELKEEAKQAAAPKSISERAVATGQQPADRHDDLNERIAAGLISALKLSKTVPELQDWRADANTKASVNDLPREIKAKVVEAYDEKMRDLIALEAVAA